MKTYQILEGIQSRTRRSIRFEMSPSEARAAVYAIDVLIDSLDIAGNEADVNIEPYLRAARKTIARTIGLKV